MPTTAMCGEEYSEIGIQLNCEVSEPGIQTHALTACSWFPSGAELPREGGSPPRPCFVIWTKGKVNE